MLRLFIAIELPPEVQAALRTAQATLARHNLPVRWVDPTGAHLTLKFLGATRPEQVAELTATLEESARGHRPFRLATATLGCFPNPRAARILWLGLAGALPALSALRDDVERRIAPLGFPTEPRPFNPHLTLGRISKDAPHHDAATIGPALAATSAPAAIHWLVRRISLMRSELSPAGPRYSCLARANLDTI